MPVDWRQEPGRGDAHRVARSLRRQNTPPGSVQPMTRDVELILATLLALILFLMPFIPG